MARLVVEVLDASDLMPKDGQGSADPFVEVSFDGQRQRTQTKNKDLYPQWNEKLIFNVSDPADLHAKTIDVTVYSEGKHGHHSKFLGRVKLSGFSVPFSESEAEIQRYPLDKRGLFSHIKGDIALKLYALPGLGNPNLGGHQPPAAAAPPPEVPLPVPQDFKPEPMNTGIGADPREIPIPTPTHAPPPPEEPKIELETKKKKKEPEVRTFFSVGAGGGPPPPPPEKPVAVEPRSDFMKAGPMPPGLMRMQMPGGQRPEFGLVETRPPLAARTGYWGRDKTASTYDLVEQMYFLFVHVVKAKDLPVMDITGSLDPYVEVRVGNYKASTRHFEKNQNPVWNEVFAFAKENMQSNMIEVIVKDKDFVKDDFVGRVGFDILEVPLRVPPDSPLAPQWYRLVGKKGERIHQGEIMLAVWMGTQADEAFPDALHSDAYGVSPHSMAHTRSKVYFSPRLFYLRVHVIEAQDLVPADKGRMPEAYVRLQLGHQARTTRPAQRHINPMWNEEIILVASEPFEDYLIIDVVDRVGPGKDEVIGRMMVPIREIPPRMGDTSKLPPPKWFNLLRPSVADEDEKKKEVKFSSKIHVILCMDAGYHVLDESTHFSSDLQPSSKLLRKPSVGILELGILNAQNLQPMKGKDGRLTDAYCIAKYGNKWVRTRTVLNNLNPRWNEQYTWEVFDPCTVITIGVFDNCHIHGKDDVRDQRIGKVRIRLSTLETDRIYTHFYPLLVLHPSGLKKHGELHLAIRFTCTAWVNMVAQYGRPLLPKMHYVHPISVRHIDWLRHQAMVLVAARLTRAEPPLRREVVEYMLDVDYHLFSLRRSKANFNRILALFSGISAIYRWYYGICYWKNPFTTILVHVLFLILVCYPELILPTVFLYLFVIGVWNYRFRPRNPPAMDARLSLADSIHPDELDEEFDSFPSSRPNEIVRMRYDRLRSVAGRVQSVLGDLATQGERALAILSWRDPRATAIFIVFALIWAVFLYVTPFQVIAVLVGLFMLRHPRFRSKLPSVPVNFFKRLPAKSDMLL
nr:FT-interacting protein 1 [Ipomoea batatas]